MHEAIQIIQDDMQDHCRCGCDVLAYDGLLALSALTLANVDPASLEYSPLEIIEIVWAIRCMEALEQ